MACTIFLPESDIRCFLCGYYSGCFAGVLVWLLFGDGVYSSESHCDTAGLSLLKHDVVGQILYSQPLASMQ